MLLLCDPERATSACRIREDVKQGRDCLQELLHTQRDVGASRPGARDRDDALSYARFSFFALE